jgi:hypothetical protein
MENPLFITLKTEDGTVVAKDHAIWAVPSKGARINWRGDMILGEITSTEEWTSTNGFTMQFKPLPVE